MALRRQATTKFGDARAAEVDIPLTLAQDRAGPDTTAQSVISAFGAIGGQARLGQVEGNLEEKLGESGVIIKTINDPKTVITEQEDGTVLVDVSLSDPHGDIDRSSEAFQRIAGSISQGKISRARGAIEAEVVLRQSIARAPGFADQLRALARDTLGFNASGAVLESLFLSGPATSTTLTLQEKQVLEAQSLFERNFYPSFNSALDAVIGQRFNEIESAQLAMDSKSAKATIGGLIVRYGAQAQVEMNPAMLNGLKQTRDGGVLTNFEDLKQGLNAAAQLMITRATEEMDANAHNRFDTADFQAVRDEIIRIRDANIALIEPDDIRAVLTRQQDTLMSLLRLKAMNIAGELFVFKEFGPAFMEKYIELMGAAAGDQQRMDLFMKVNPQYKFVGELAWKLKDIGPAMRAVQTGGLAAAIESGRIDKETGLGVLKFLGINEIEGINPLVSKDGGEPAPQTANVINSLADLDLPEMVLSTAAQTNQSWAKMTGPEGKQAKANVVSEFNQAIPFIKSGMVAAMVNTPWAAGWDRDRGQFNFQLRSQAAGAVAVKRFKRDLGGSKGRLGDFSDLSQTLRAQRGGLDTVLGTSMSPPDMAVKELAVLNNSMLGLMSKPEWRNELGIIDPDQWATEFIADMNASMIDVESATPGEGTGTISQMTFEQQIRFRKALQLQDNDALFEVLKDMGLNPGNVLNEKVEGIGEALVRLDTPGTFEDPNDPGRIITFDAEGNPRETRIGGIDRSTNQGLTSKFGTGEVETVGDFTFNPPLELEPHDPILNLTIKAAIQKAGLPVNLMLALIQQESEFDNDAVSVKDAIGLMQMTPDAATDIGDDAVATDIAGNLRQGLAFFNLMLTKFDGDFELALAAYNGGGTRLEGFDRDINKMPPETRNYVKAILANVGIKAKFLK